MGNKGITEYVIEDKEAKNPPKTKQAAKHDNRTKTSNTL